MLQMKNERKLNNVAPSNDLYDEKIINAILTTASIMYKKQHSQKIKEGIRRSKLKKAMNAEPDKENSNA